MDALPVSEAGRQMGAVSRRLDVEDKPESRKQSEKKRVKNQTPMRGRPGPQTSQKARREKLRDVCTL